MFRPRQFLRMSRWARHPPSATRVKLVAAILAVMLVVAGIEHFIGWPEFLTLDPRPPRLMR
ncbi:hypothetical protein U5922_006640 [Aquicoccus sp. G2-2]|uniref:hypothetical protein n=1 Tax=Aquicoccus sp. G2-2 TaxID=3092120 RepID=UPI002AE04CF0|nr:hypothetical protein [Aquicoccus sp. G2-2]MEA1113166.1 hypothetical protein [Aquicoccus sp. G2-2]